MSVFCEGMKKSLGFEASKGRGLKITDAMKPIKKTRHGRQVALKGYLRGGQS
jgi:hypothetical protein